MSRSSSMVTGSGSVDTAGRPIVTPVTGYCSVCGRSLGESTGIVNDASGLRHPYCQPREARVVERWRP